MKVIVFDLGGTLMEYKGMPLSWVDYYATGFRTINEQYCCNVTELQISGAVEILKSYNPRINYREIEYSPQYIFEKALKSWNVSYSLDKMIYSFFSALHLEPVLYDETIPTLSDLKERKYKIAVLTDLPTAMPDELFRNDISELMQYIDLYVSSLSCGYRKPNPQGLKNIAQKFNVEINEFSHVFDSSFDNVLRSCADCLLVLADLIPSDEISVSFSDVFSLSKRSFLHIER